MPRESTPYDVPSESSYAAISPGAKFAAFFVGLLVLAGSAGTLGMFLFGVLVISAGSTQPSPIQSTDLLSGARQQLLLAGGGSIALGISVWLAAFVVAKILKSQQMVAEVSMRRRELQAVVSRMHTEVLEEQNKRRSTNPHQ